jgi:hypothetical protein
MMIAPTQPTITLKRSAELFPVGEQGNQRIHAASHEHRCRLVGENQCDLVGHGIHVIRCVVRRQPGRGLAVEPLASEPSIAADLRSQIVCSQRTSARHRPVVAHLVTEPYGQTERRTRHMARQLADQLLDTSLIDGHDPRPPRMERCLRLASTPGFRSSRNTVAENSPS